MSQELCVVLFRSKLGEINMNKKVVFFFFLLRTPLSRSDDIKETIPLMRRCWDIRKQLCTISQTESSPNSSPTELVTHEVNT